ncbi:hypothetical protein [Amycolatopsis lexingtonensis]|uniref:hypothetical protein n=1 Tax=Amycolatopsis lexingtonensis TaxID=218822 RepID=UPI003F6F48F1
MAAVEPPARFWRPTWGGVELDDPNFTFHEGRHTHSTWLTEDGMAMVNQILDTLEERWLRSLTSLYPGSGPDPGPIAI